LFFSFCHQINAYLQELAVNYPQLVTLESIGKSYQGRDMVVIKISSGGNGTRPVILVDGGIHAREWVAPAMALYIINQLVEKNAANSALTDAVDWYILPVLNPDGYEYSHTNVSEIYSHPLHTNDS
jgi:murein tripeptide amidase MpaA